MRPVDPELKQQAIHLRLTTDLSTPAIAKALSIAINTAYNILQDHPWQRPTKVKWTTKEEHLLRDIYPSYDQLDILRLLPRHKWHSITRHANKRGLHRLPPTLRDPPRPVHPLITALRRAREEQLMTRKQLEEKSGHARGQILSWETGKATPSLLKFEDWANSLGYTITMSDLP